MPPANSELSPRTASSRSERKSLTGNTKPSSSSRTRASRSRSTDDRMIGQDARKTRNALKGVRRINSTGDLNCGNKSSLRVKSQQESLKKNGLYRSRQNTKKRIEFAFLEVREFPMILGDNPSCSDGPPVTIDWAYDPKTQFILDVNTFESMRGIRRINKQLIISRGAREKCLSRCGFATKDMVAAMRQLRKDRHSRMVSSQQVGMDNLHEATEKVTAGFKKMFVFKKSDYEKKLAKACAISATPQPLDVN